MLTHMQLAALASCLSTQSPRCYRRGRVCAEVWPLVAVLLPPDFCLHCRLSLPEPRCPGSQEPFWGVGPESLMARPWCRVAATSRALGRHLAVRKHLCSFLTPGVPAAPPCLESQTLVLAASAGRHCPEGCSSPSSTSSEGDHCAFNHMSLQQRLMMEL